MTDTKTALLYTAALAAVIFFCRLLPFLLFSKGGEMPCLKAGGLSRRERMAKMKKSFVLFVEKTVPPAAMAVLAVSSLAQPVKTSLLENGLSSAVLLQCAPCLISAAACAALHALKRNPLLSIFCATALYMLLVRLF